MQRTTLVQSAREAAIATLACIVLTLFLVAATWIGIALGAAGHGWGIIAELIVVVFALLTVARYAFDRL